MLVGKKEYGTWKDGSSVYKDNKGYYVAWTDNSIKLKVPIKKTNVIYK